MGWVSVALGSFVLTIVLISIAATFAGFLTVTHQSCVPAATSSSSSNAFQLFGAINSTSSTASTNATLAPVALAPLPIAADDLVLSPLADLSLAPSDGGSDGAVSDLLNATYWKEVHASEFQTYEEIIPQTVLGFFNDSEAWKDWALQYIPNSTTWLSTSFVVQAQGQVTVVDPSGDGQTESSTAIAEGIQNFAATAAGVTLASLDFVSFNGLTALKTYFETGNTVLAACQTLPGQLAQLYKSSFDSSAPQAERAEYLGRALAITSVMLLLGGKDDIADGFQTAIDNVGLGDAWSTVKPYLGDIAAQASASTASATLAILQTLAQRFPQDSVWATGLTADRIDAMVQVFHEDGLPNDVVQNDIQKVAQAAAGSPNEDGGAVAADQGSLDDGKWLKVSVRSQNRMSLYQDSTGRTESIKTSFLQTNVPGFNPKAANFVQITYKEAGVSVYQYYGGPSDNADGSGDSGVTWTPKAPSDVAQEGTIVSVKFSVLTPQAFVDRMPTLEFDGLSVKSSWMTLASRFTSYTLSGDDLRIAVSQAGFGGLDVTNFEVDGTDSALKWDGKTTSLDFQVPDVFGVDTEMRLTYNGYSNPQLRIFTGQSDFAQVLLVSSDGVRLKFLYDTGPSTSSTTTIYVQAPSVLYSVSDKVPGDPQYLANGGTAVYQIDSVTTTRTLETSMINGRATYDLGTVGAEIAYTIGTEQLGIQNLILHEPSEGGPDLNTADKTIFIQARMVDLSEFPSDTIPGKIQGQLLEMIKTLQDKDFGNNATTAKMGYAIISYIDDQNTIQTIIVQVPYQ